MTEAIVNFFSAWDHLEASYPFGVMYFASIFMEHGVSAARCGDVDEFIFMDLMIPRNPMIRRIKVEGRVDREVFWVYVDMNSSLVSFQSHPSAPLVCSMPMEELPDDLIRMILSYFRHLHQQTKKGPGCVSVLTVEKFKRCE